MAYIEENGLEWMKSDAGVPEPGIGRISVRAVDLFSESSPLLRPPPTDYQPSYPSLLRRCRRSPLHLECHGPTGLIPLLPIVSHCWHFYSHTRILPHRVSQVPPDVYSAVHQVFVRPTWGALSALPIPTIFHILRSLSRRTFPCTKTRFDGT
jgi:hypothetical protein